jgi:hypothetical protein
MDIKYKIVGLKKLQKAVHEAPGIMFNKNIEAMHRSVDLVAGLLIADTPMGPGHFGFHERDRWSTRVRVGPRRIVGVVANSAAQSRWREFGTKAHEIAPKKASVLKIGDTFATVVHHPGEKARHSTKKALAASKSAIKVFFVDAARGVTQHMATSGD